MNQIKIIQNHPNSLKEKTKRQEILFADEEEKESENVANSSERQESEATRENTVPEIQVPPENVEE